MLLAGAVAEQSMNRFIRCRGRWKGLSGQLAGKSWFDMALAIEG
jgi:hypothetical protein